MSQPEAAGKKKKKSAKGSPGVSFSTRLRNARQGAGDVLRSLGSADAPTRRVSGVFVASLLGIALVAGFAVKRYVAYRHARGASLAAAKREEAMLADFLKKQSDIARKKNVMFSLGQFSLELRSPAGEVASQNTMNMADLEIVLECDSKETRVYFEDNLPQARNQVTDALTAMERQELMSLDGKLRLKHRLIEKLNAMLPQGRIENLYFSKLILS